MYICPTCKQSFENAEIIAKHSLRCWKANNPNHQVKSAPCKGNVTERYINNDVLNFFSSFRKDS